MATSPNPFLVGYEHLIKRSSLDRARAEPQVMSSMQPMHPILTQTSVARAPAAVSRTNASVPAEPVQQEWSQPERAIQQLVQLQPATYADGSSSIDILIPAPAEVVSGQLPPADGVTRIHSRPQTPTTLNFLARPPGGGVGQIEPAAVEITISTQPEEQQYEQQYVSHLQGLTVQQMLDLDIDALVVKIDEHHSLAKKAVLDHFIETKARLLQAKNEALEEEKSKAASRIAAKEEELNLMKAEADTMQTKSQRLWDLVSRMCTAYGKAKERRRINLMQFQVFCAWRHQAMALARRRRMVARAERWDVDSRLKRNVFRAWFRQAMRAHRATVNNRYIAEVENAKRLIHEHYQRQIGDLEHMLRDVHLQLEREAEARSRLEEDMKRAFMRGVCALNIEAMNMMKRGAGAALAGANQPGGAAPPPPSGEQQSQEQAAGSSLTISSSGYNGQGPVVGQALPDASSVESPGAITFSPPRLSVAISQSAAGGSGGGSNLAAASLPGQPLVTAIGSSAPTAGTVNSVIAGGSSRPGSNYGLVPAAAMGVGVGGGGSSHISGRVSVMQQQATGAMQGPPVSGGGAEGGPAIRETAQTFYQRPQVLVTRGPGIGAAVLNADAPRPRSNAPLPTVRML